MEVLRPQDVLAPSFHRRRHFPANGDLTNLFVNKRPYNNSGHGKKISPKSEKNSAPFQAKKSKDVTGVRRKENVNTGGLVMGQVMLLKRGEPLDSLASKVNSGSPTNPPKMAKLPKPKAKSAGLAVRGNARIRPDLPEKGVLKQIRMAPKLDTYAGSGVFTSPSPRSVPLPSFFMTPATVDVRRMLNLDLGN